MIEINYLEIDSRELMPNINEVALRLHMPRERVMPYCEKLLNRLKANVKCRGVWSRVPIKRTDNGLDLGFGEFISHDLEKNLSGCDEAFLFCVTLGLDVDRYLMKLSSLSPADHFVADGLASSLCEALADEAERIIKENSDCKPRYSPGYGDMSIETQKGLLELLNAGKLLGISLTKSYLMTPIKTITAIVGIEK